MLFIIKLIVTIVIIVAIYLSINIQMLTSYLNMNYITAILFVQPIILLSLFFASMRLSILSTVNRNNHVSFINGFKATVLCYGLGLALPMRLSEFLKPVYLRKQCGISLSTGIAAVALERISDIVILTVLAIAGAALFFNIDLNKILFVFCILALFILVIFLFDKYLLCLFEVRFTNIWHKFLFNIVRNFVAKSKRKSTYIAFAFGLIGWFFSLSSMVLYFKIVGVSDIGLDGYLLVFLGSIIAGAIPALPGGFGMYEASVVYVLDKYGYSFDEAIILAIGLHVSQLIFVFCATIYLSLFGKLGISSIISEIKSLNFKDSKNSKR